MADEELESIRGEIRTITRNIIRLYANRQEKSRIASELKKAKGLGTRDPEVERTLRNSVIEECKHVDLEVDQGLRLMNFLVDSSLKVQGMTETDALSKRKPLFAEAKRMEYEGQRIHHLEIGEPDFGAPTVVVEEVSKSLREGRARYTEAGGIPELREAIATSTNQRYGSDISAKNVIVSPGSRFATLLAIQSTMRQGGEALIPEPAWPGHRDLTELAGGHPVALHTTPESKWSPATESFQDKMTEATDIIIMNYPNNPTGKILEEHILRGIFDLASDRDVCVIWDEAYARYSFKPFKSIMQMPIPKFVLVSTLSKSHAMTGYRLGYAISDEDTINKMVEIQRISLTSVSEFIQRGALKALESEEEVRRNAAAVRDRMTAAEKSLRSLPVSFVEPDGGIYIFMKVLREGFDSYEFSQKLLRERRVAVAPGTMFGNYPDHLRISCCIGRDAIVESIERMGELLA